MSEMCSALTSPSGPTIHAGSLWPGARTIGERGSAATAARATPTAPSVPSEPYASADRARPIASSECLSGRPSWGATNPTGYALRWRTWACTCAGAWVTALARELT